MKVFHNLESFVTCSPNKLSLSIGNFDGLHLGHQEVLKKLSANNHEATILTFSNHPASVLKSKSPLFLCTLPHKLFLFEQFGVKNVILLEFTKQLAKLSAEQFLSNVKKHIPFTYLVLGHDAVIGYNREGNVEKLKQLALKNDFLLEYVSAVEIDKTPISSTLIRAQIEKGNLEIVENYLGRKFSILSTIQRGMGKGEVLGFRTINLNVQELSIPPLGVYAVKVNIGNKIYSGIANLGLAPTIKKSAYPELEVHLFDCTNNLYGLEAEVVFLKFIRQEKKFETIDQLKQQITDDIHFIKDLGLP